MSTVSALAGKPIPAAQHVNLARLVAAYYTEKPEPGNKEQRVAFGTSGHRGSSLRGSFTETHILAVTEAICRYRKRAGITGPLFLGMDTHALSEAAWRTALEVLAAHEVTVMVDAGLGFTPTPAVSHAILEYNRGRQASEGWADGIVITPSHNPPEDGGFKYNPPNGGPADTNITKAVEAEANELLGKAVPRVGFAKALAADTTRRFDYIGQYVGSLAQVIDVEAIAGSGV
ncbi:phosphoglucomutase, alpha-D-glucose phosphate-specific, partial [Nostoc sp. NIES-2111]